MRKTKTKAPSVIFGLGEQEAQYYENLAKAEIAYRIENDKEKPSLAKSIINMLNGDKDNVVRLAFETDPSQVNNFAGVYRAKLRLVPDSVLKRIAIQDSLVAAIVRARQNHVSAFGRPRPDRFSLGFVVKPNTGTLDKLDEEGKDKLGKQIDNAIKLLSTCGHTEGVPTEHQATFAEYLCLITRSAVVCGRIATEIVWGEDNSGRKKFSHFVATDSGTIYRATKDKTGQEAIRKEAYRLLCRVMGEKLVEEKWNNQDYTWVQVIDGTPKQVFTSEEMRVYNMYPVPDVELDGYPVTPIDTVITAITTHVNITTHNKMYFQSGRASRGMIIIKSDDVNSQMLSQIKQNFNASINSSAMAWRMPVFGVPTDSELSWQPLDTGGGRDMEFQYLMDMNAREILTAFMMSPDELPGYSYLSRGTASQALSECVASESRILTDDGLVSVGGLVGDLSEKSAKIWSGARWVDGRVFRSGSKRLIETELDCGVVLKTSPDHRFRVVNDAGELDWKHQSELSVGDMVLVNKTEVTGDESKIPEYKGKKLSLEMMEILGWATGDGCFVDAKKRAGAYIKLFYHSEKERDLWSKHNDVLSTFGLSVKHVERVLTDEQKDKIKEVNGFSTVAKSRIYNSVYDTDFFRWLKELGFSPSSRGANGKTIPAVFHVLPIEYRAAFLRGLFSADGGRIGHGDVALTIQNDRLRDQIRQMLLGMGIRTLKWNGLVRRSFGDVKTFSHKLVIKDKKRFWDTIGFSQSFKQYNGKDPEKWTIARPPIGIVKACLAPCLVSSKFKGLSKGQRDYIKKALRGGSCTFQRLERLASDCGVELPKWFNDYYFESIRRIVDTDTVVDMYDVEMFDAEHAFVVDGVITHNSNTEWKLQAARDVGIRPLLGQIEDFINSEIFPLIDADLAKKARICLAGLEASTPEKEAVQLQTAAEVYMHFDDILQKVEKKPVGKRWGGEIPMNPVYQQILDKYFTVGQILEQFCGVEGASKEPTLAYIPNPFWFQYQQMLQQQQQLQQMQQQAQMQAQQQQQQGQPPLGGEQQDPDQGKQQPTRENPSDDQTERERSAKQASDLGSAVGQAYDLMQKSEGNMPPEKRKILAQHKKTLSHFVRGFEDDVKGGIKEILDMAEKLGPRK